MKDWKDLYADKVDFYYGMDGAYRDFETIEKSLSYVLCSVESIGNKECVMLDIDKEDLVQKVNGLRDFFETKCKEASSYL